MRTELRMNWLSVVKKRSPPESRPMTVDLWCANKKLSRNRLVGDYSRDVGIQVEGADGSVDVHKFPFIAVADHRTPGCRGPAAPETNHPPESSLVLKHQAHRPPRDYFRFQQGCQRFGKFFPIPLEPRGRSSDVGCRERLCAIHAGLAIGTAPKVLPSGPAFRPRPRAKAKPLTLRPAEPVPPREPGTLVLLPSSATLAVGHLISCAGRPAF